MAKEILPLHEMDLYPPLEKFLSSHGYLVHAEVVFSDISATKEGFLLVVEIKLRFNLEVILQALERQRSADAVYIAIPLYNFKPYPKKWRLIRSLCSKLGIGVLFVRFVENQEPQVEVALVRKSSKEKSSASKEVFLEEMSRRGKNWNKGGSVRKPLITAYRKEALRIAQLLDEKGPLSPFALRKLGCVSNTGRILSNNYYGWFERIQKGLYCVTDKGKQALEQYRYL